MKTLEQYSSKGFFTIAQNTNKVDYLRIAYLQALNIKYTQKTINSYSVGVTPGTIIPDKYKEVFDNVIEIPWGDDAINTGWKLNNEWKSIYMSPYESTIKIDSDLLFFEDIQSWWYIFAHHDIVPCIEVLDYRGNVSNSMYYRKEIELNGLPNFYSGLFYFRKCPTAYELFDTSKEIFRAWSSGIDKLLYDDKDLKRNQETTDVVFALASKVLGINYHLKFNKFVHMKKEIQDVQDLKLNERWTDSLRYHFDNELNLFIENFKQTYPVHYYLKEFASSKLISQYEKALGI